MRPHLLLLPLLLLTACEKVGKNPWAKMDFAEANCGTREAILTMTGCVTAPPTNPVSATAKPKTIHGPNNVEESHLLDDSDQMQLVNNSTIHDNNANSTIHGVNGDNTIHGTDASNNIHGNDTTDNIHAGPANNNTTTTVLGYNSSQGPTTSSYGNNTNVGSVYGNTPGAANGISTGSGVEGPVTGVYGDNNSTGADHK